MELDFGKLKQLNQEAKQIFNSELCKFDVPEESSVPEEPKLPRSVADLLDLKLGVKDTNTGFIAKNLAIFYNSSDPLEKSKALALAMARLNETPAGKKVLGQLAKELQPVINKLPENLKNIFNKLFTDGAKSDTRIKHIAALLDDKWEAKDVRAIYELLNDFGPDIKHLLPQKAQDFINRLELLMGKALGQHVKKFLPAAGNADFAKATLKFITGDGVDKIAGGLDFVKAAGLKLFGEGGKFDAVMNFLSIDTRTADGWRALLTSPTGQDSASKDSALTHPSANARHPAKPQPPQLAPGRIASTSSILGSSSTLNLCATK